MTAEQLSVIIFDDSEVNGRFIYRDIAARATTEAGLIPEVFEEVRPAVRRMLEAEDVLAVVSSLGTRGLTGFEHRYPAQPLLQAATREHKPIALLSGHPDAAKHIDTEAGDITVPKQNYEQIAPTLHDWFQRLMHEPASAR
jgi:hypothetical protein